METGPYVAILLDWTLKVDEANSFNFLDQTSSFCF